MSFFQDVKGKLIVSCQALPDEPLHSPFIMGRMAKAAKEGGATAIRAQGCADINEIKKVTGLPVIGLIKRNYDDSPIYITPTITEVEDLLTTNCEMIALDMKRAVSRKPIPSYTRKPTSIRNYICPKFHVICKLRPLIKQHP